MITYVFRKPVYPVIYEFNGHLIGGRTEKEFVKNLHNIKSKKPHDLIDATGEVWLLSTDPLVMSPISFKKRFTKKKLIETYNNSNNCKENKTPYSEKSLSNKKYNKILEDILKLI
jgi:hypothetical protein